MSSPSVAAAAAAAASAAAASSSSSSVPTGFVHARPDSSTSWFILALAFLVNAIPVGILRTYGLLYAHVRSTYGVTRAEASWPLSLVNSMLYLAGPLGGVLSNHFQIRVIIFGGILLSATGVAASFLARNIFEVTITFGVIQGVGVGVVNMVVPVLLNQYFLKFRTTATGISMAGNTMGTFVLSPVVAIILNRYTLEGAFLLLAGMILQALPVAILMRPPVRSQLKKWRLISMLAKKTARNLPVAAVARRNSELKGLTGPTGQRIRRTATMAAVRRPFRLTPEVPLKCICPVPPPPLDSSRFLSARSIIKYSAMVSVRHDCLNIPFIDDEALTDEEAAAAENGHRRPPRLNLNFKDHIHCCCDRYGSISGGASWRPLAAKKSVAFEVLPPKVILYRADSTDATMAAAAAKSNWCYHWKSFFRIVRNPLFWIATATHTALTWSWGTYGLIIVDFAEDKGVSHDMAVVLIAVFSAADLIGRLGSGFLSDYVHIKKRNMAFSYILTIAFILWMIPVAEDFATLAALTFGLGLMSGSLVVLFGVLLTEYVGLKLMAAALGWSAFFSGVATFPRPLLLGYYRDERGSYEGLFQLLSVACVAAALLWLAAPFAELQAARRRSKYRIKLFKGVVRPITTPSKAARRRNHKNGRTSSSEV